MLKIIKWGFYAKRFLERYKSYAFISCYGLYKCYSFNFYSSNALTLGGSE